ncbi:MAG TPA: hypothetical protein VGB83_00320 [Actinomycetota bacterium]
MIARSTKPLVLLCLQVLLLGSCTAQTTATDFPDAASSRTNDASANHGSGEKQGETGPGGSGSGGGGGSAGGGGGGSGFRYPDDERVGDMAVSYISADHATRLVVEVDYVRGREPSQAVLDHVRAILQRDLDKPQGITVRRGNAFEGPRDRYTIDEIRTLENLHRSSHSSGSTATMWIAYLNGSYAESSGVLGVAYRASSAAIFAERIEEAATQVLRPASIERSVVTHEVGHLLGLVNIGYTSAFDHEDAAHPGHSSNEGSVMYWQIEDISIRNLLGGPPDDFDEMDRADLAARR